MNGTDTFPIGGDSWTDSLTNWGGLSSDSNSYAPNISLGIDVKTGKYSVNASFPNLPSGNWSLLQYDEGGTWDVSNYRYLSFWIKTSETQSNNVEVRLRRSGSGDGNRWFVPTNANSWKFVTLDLAKPDSIAGSETNYSVLDRITFMNNFSKEIV